MSPIEDLFPTSPPPAAPVVASPWSPQPDVQPARSGLEELFGPIGEPPRAGVRPLPSAPTQRFDAVRGATAFEKFLDALGTPSNYVAGATDALLRGEDPLLGGQLGTIENTTFGRLLKDRGMASLPAAVLGFGLDVATDPLNLVGAGVLTKAGKGVRAITRSLETAEMIGDAAGIARHTAQLAGRARFAGTAAERARVGQQALVTVAGRSVLPRKMSERVFEQTDKVWSAAGNSDIAQSLGNVFRSVAQRAPEAARAVFFANRAEGAKLTRESIEKLIQPHAEAVKKMAAKTGVPYEVAAAVVAHAVQLGKDPADIDAAIRAGKALFGGNNLHDPTLRAAVDAINLANSTTIAGERAAGLKISELLGDQQYLKRAITKEALELMRAANPTFKGMGAREIATTYGAQLMREEGLRDLTIAEINELGRQGKLRSTGFKAVREFFHEDPFVATAYRLQEGSEAIADITFLKQAANIYGHVFAPGAGLPAGMRTISSTIAEDLGLRKLGAHGKVLQDVAFPREVADLIDMHYERVLSPQYLQSFLKIWDQAQGVWKTFTLPIWPTYHVRNLLSDTWMMTAVPGGMPLGKLPYRLQQAGAALLSGTRVGRALPGMRQGRMRLGGEWYTLEELKALAERTGVTQVDVARDLDELVKRPLAAKRDVLEKVTSFAPIRAAITVGNARENMGRMAYFIERLARGESPEFAALEVKKRLFDYGDMSPVEKQLLRRVFPFYSWSRHNIPFQISHLLARPGYGSRLEHLRAESAVGWGEEDIGQGVPGMPPFLKRGVPLPWGRNAEGNPRFARLQNIVPLGDVANVASPRAAVQTLIDQASPLMKAPLESAANVDLYRSDIPAGRLARLENFPGEAESVLGMPVPGRWTPMLDLVRPVQELNRANPFGMFGGRYEPSALGITRTQPDISASERAWSLFGPGRAYGVDEMQQLVRANQMREAAMSRLEILLRQAYARGDTSNAQKIEQLMMRLQSDPTFEAEVVTR